MCTMFYRKSQTIGGRIGQTRLHCEPERHRSGGQVHLLLLTDLVFTPLTLHLAAAWAHVAHLLFALC